MKQRNSNCERNKLHLLIWTNVKFYSSKNLFKLIKQKDDFDKRAKSYTKMKIGSEITIENSREKSERKKN